MRRAKSGGVSRGEAAAAADLLDRFSEWREQLRPVRDEVFKFYRHIALTVLTSDYPKGARLLGDLDEHLGGRPLGLQMLRSMFFKICYEVVQKCAFSGKHSEAAERPEAAAPGEARVVLAEDLMREFDAQMDANSRGFDAFDEGSNGALLASGGSGSEPLVCLVEVVPRRSAVVHADGVSSEYVHIDGVSSVGAITVHLLINDRTVDPNDYWKEAIGTNVMNISKASSAYNAINQSITRSLYGNPDEEEGGGRTKRTRRRTPEDEIDRTNIWTTVTTETLPTLVSNYSMNSDTARRSSQLQLAGIEFTEDNPLHACRVFSLVNALMVRPADCPDEQSFMYYAREWGRNRRAERGPYMKPSERVGSWRTWMPPPGAEGRFWKLETLTLLNPELIMLKGIPTTATFDHVFTRMFAALFRDTTQRSQVVSAAPLVPNPTFSRETLSGEQLQYLHDLMRQYPLATVAGKVAELAEALASGALSPQVTAAQRGLVRALGMIATAPQRLELERVYAQYMADVRVREEFIDAYRHAQEMFGMPTDDVVLDPFDTTAIHRVGSERLQRLYALRRRMPRRAMMHHRIEDINHAVLGVLQKKFSDFRSITAKERCIVMRLYRRGAEALYRAHLDSAESDVSDSLRALFKERDRLDFNDPGRRAAVRMVDRTLSPFANAMATRLNEYDVVYAAALPWLVLKMWTTAMTAWCFKFQQHGALLAAGDAAKSKSHSLQIMCRLLAGDERNLAESTYRKQIFVTNKAEATDSGGLNNHLVVVIHELPRVDIVGDAAEDGVGNPQAKQIADHQCALTVANKMNEDGYFETAIRVNERIHALVACCNWDVNSAPDPAMSRMLVQRCMQELNVFNNIDVAVTREDTQTYSDTVQRVALNVLHHQVQYCVAQVEMRIKARVLADVCMWMANPVLVHVNAHLKRNGYQEIPVRARVILTVLMRTVAILDVVTREFFTPGGHFFGMSIDDNIARLEPYLWIGLEHAVFVLGVYSDCVFYDYVIENQIRVAIQSMYRRKRDSRDLDSIFSRMRVYNHANDQAPDTGGTALPPTLRAASHMAAGRLRDAQRDDDASYAYDFSYLRINPGGADPEADAANRVAAELAAIHDGDYDDLKAQVDTVVSQHTLKCVIKKLEARPCRAVKYIRPDPNAVNTEPGATDEQLNDQVMSRRGHHVRVLTSWVMKQTKPPGDMIREALEDLCNHRHQPPMRCLWSVNKRCSNTFDVIELGSADCDSPDKPLLERENYNTIDPEEAELLYGIENADNHAWKRFNTIAMDRSLDACAAAVHGRAIHAHEGAFTHRDEAVVFHTLPEVLRAYDRATYRTDGFVALDDARDINHDADMWTVRCGQTSMHLADYIFQNTGLLLSEAERREHFFKDLFYTLPHVVRTRFLLAANDSDNRIDSEYPEVFRRKYTQRSTVVNRSTASEMFCGGSSADLHMAASTAVRAQAAVLERAHKRTRSGGAAPRY